VAFGTIFGRSLPKNEHLGAIFSGKPGRRQRIFNELALFTRWHANWIGTVGKI
jgi:hypothetical protein